MLASLIFGIYTGRTNRLLLKYIFATRYFREVAKVTKFAK